MSTRIYLSNICPRWPIAKQRELLGQRELEYVDELRPAALKRRSAVDLKDRAEILKPTRRTSGEVIEVASFQVLAWNTQDFCQVIAAASARNATLRALDTGREIVPHPVAEAVAFEVEEFGLILKRRGLGRTPGELAEDRRKDTARRIGLIADDWGRPETEVTTKALLARAGTKPGKPMAPQTARDLLGSRKKAQQHYAMMAVQEAGRAASRARRKGESV